jgi:hypothetical protein
LKDLVFKRFQLDKVDSSRQSELLVDFLVRSSIGLLVTLVALFIFSGSDTDTAMNKTGEVVYPATLASPGLAIAPVSEAERFNRAWYKTHLEAAGPPDSGHNAALKSIPDTDRGSTRIHTGGWLRKVPH